MDNNNTNAPGFPPVDNQQNDDDFGLIDFVNDANFEQFIELIRGESADPIVKFCPKFDCDHISGCYDENQFLMPIHEETLFHQGQFYVADNVDPNFAPNDTLPGGMKFVTPEAEKEAEDNDGEESSATTTTNTRRGTKGDRSRTLVSERRRRGRMKEKLYALRALVPNITKMDKASIIGDAVLYVQDLQMQAKKLNAEIAALESSLTQPNLSRNRSSQNTNNINYTYNHPTIKKILQINVVKVEEKEFYVRVVCKNDLGVAVSLYKALESLSSFIVQSSNLATSTEDYVLTFTLNVKECNMEMELQNLKLWVATAFLNQGFDFETSL